MLRSTIVTMGFILISGCQEDVSDTATQSGTNTLDGANGVNGTNGTNGASGHDGAQGPQGPQGLQGPAGANGADGDAAQLSGTRLKAQFYAGKDGSQFAALGMVYDDLRKEDCNPYSRAADGKLRCLPIGGAATVYPYFIDAACTLSVVVTGTCTPPKYAIKYSPAGTCAAPTLFGYGIFLIGSRISAGTQLFYKQASGTCSGAGVVPADAAIAVGGYYNIGAEVPPTEFQELELVTQ